MNILKPQEPSIWSPGTPQEPPPFGWVPDLVSFLRRRWTTMAAVAVAVTGLSLGYAMIQQPQYLAAADILFDIRRADLLRQQGGIQDSMTLSSVLESQVEVLRSEGMARKVVAKLHLADDPEFMPPPARPGLVDQLRGVLSGLLSRATESGAARSQPAQSRETIAAERLMSMTGVRRIGLTYVIDVSVKSPSPTLSARLANGLAEAYIADQLDAKNETTRQAGVWLEARIQELRDQALAADRAVQEYKAQNNIVDTDRGLINEQQLGDLNSQLTAARSRTAEAQARLDRVQSVLQAGVGADGSVAEALQNPVIVTLRQRYVEDARREADWAAKYGENHVAAVGLRNEMAEIKRSIQGELGRIAETAKSDLEVARSGERALQARMTQLVSQTATTNNDRVALRSLESSAETYRSLYENFLQRYTQAVQDQSFPVPEARVVTPATPPLRKSDPKVTIMVALGAVMGLGLGFVVAFLREALDRGIRTAAQVRTATGLDCLGLLPGLSPRETRLRRVGPGITDAIADRRLISQRPAALHHVAEYPQSRFAEAIRAVRMKIARQHLRSRHVKVIGCVAAERGVGTSTVAANLAQYLARSGCRTLLLDWDFANAGLSGELANDAESGFLDTLSGRTKLSAALWRDAATGLCFLPAGQGWGSASAMELLNTEAMADLLSELRTDFDYVVVDLPALSEVADAHAATHLLDAFVLVAEWGRTDPDTLVENVARVDLGDTRMLGVVLNKVNLKLLRHYPRSAPELIRAGVPAF